jgi:hypothetical protein
MIFQYIRIATTHATGLYIRIGRQNKNRNTNIRIELALGFLKAVLHKVVEEALTRIQY